MNNLNSFVLLFGQPQRGASDPHDELNGLMSTVAADLFGQEKVTLFSDTSLRAEGWRGLKLFQSSKLWKS